MNLTKVVRDGFFSIFNLCSGQREMYVANESAEEEITVRETRSEDPLGAEPPYDVSLNHLEPTVLPRRDSEVVAKKEIVRRETTTEDPLRDELLSGIPNDVTLNHIATLLPRTAYEVVAKVSPDWQRAFRGRMVYDARVRSQNTQTFWVVSFGVSNMVDDVGPFSDSTISRRAYKNILSLFSPSEQRWSKLPPIPGSEGMRFGYTHVLLDGSIYLLGGRRKWWDVDIPSAEVYVLDLAGQPLEWRRCANMQVARCRFAIGLMHGKIYVFGGRSGVRRPYLNEDGNKVYDRMGEVRNEVYDPKADAWSFIAPSMPSAYVRHVFSIRQQFFACVGRMSTQPIPEPEEPLIDGSELYRDTKIVVTLGDSGGELGPVLISTRQDDAEDDMDWFHTIVANHKNFNNLDRPVSRRRSPAERLASKIRYHEQHNSNAGTESFLGFYVPDKEEWRVFGKESLGADADVDEYLSRGHSSLKKKTRPRRDDYLTAFVWSMSL